MSRKTIEELTTLAMQQLESFKLQLDQAVSIEQRVKTLESINHIIQAIIEVLKASS